jgi:glycosyltransferase involved in cell wall biosynthesis
MSERWKAVAIDLDGPLTELSCEPGYGGLRAVFLRSGVALGHSVISAAELPLAPAHLAAIAANAVAEASGAYLLEEGFRSALPGLRVPAPNDPESVLAALCRLDSPIATLPEHMRNPEGESRMSVSVAVCTHERPVELARCLESILSSLDHAEEIIVIDNAPASSATRDVVARFEGVRYIREPRKGLSAARNAALASASCDIVAFADDDVTVHREWVGRIRGSFADPSVMVVTGLVLPAELETRAQRVFEQDLQFFHQGYRRRRFDSNFFQRTRGKGAPVWSIGAGANMAIRHTAYRLGYQFDTRLGPGVFGGCGEDSEYWYRLLYDGWTCLYEPSISVSHYHRRDLPALRRLAYQYMKGHVAALILQFQKTREIGNLRRLLIRLPAEYLILLLRSAATGFPLEYRIQLRGALGCWDGLRFAFPGKERSACS